MPTTPYNTGKVLIGSNLPLPSPYYNTREGVSRDAYRLQSALLRPMAQASAAHPNLLTRLLNFLKGPF